MLLDRPHIFQGDTKLCHLLINYFQIPEVILYHIITAGGFDPNQLTPGTDEGEFFFTLNGSPIFVGLNQTASGTLS